MKSPAILLTLVVLCIFPATALGHPGKTDRHGGHKCLRDCEEWKLYYSEYHLHDKYGRPIRIAKRPKRHVAPVLATAPTVTGVPPQSEPPLTAQTVTVYQYVTLSSEEREPVNPLLWVLVVLLLLLLIVRTASKKEKK